MGDWERYRPEVVDAVFQEMGAASRHSKSDPESYAWARIVDGITRLASFTPETGIPGIRADHLELLARRLGVDPAEVFRRVKRNGGRIIDLLEWCGRRACAAAQDATPGGCAPRPCPR